MSENIKLPPIDVEAYRARAEAGAATIGDVVLRPKNDWGELPFSPFDPSVEPEPLDYLWGPFAAGKVSAIVAYAYTAKTPLALLLAICVALGREFLGGPTKRVKVMYIASEGARNARRKAQRIARAMGTTLARLADHLEITQAPSGWLDASTAAELCERAKANGVGLVLIDTYGSALDGEIDRNANAFSDALKQLGDCSDETGIVFGVLLHLNKSAKPGTPPLQAIDGHNSVAGALQAAVALTRPDPADKHRIQVSCVRAPDEEFEPIEIKWVDVAAPVAAGGSFGARVTAAHKGEAVGMDWGLRADVIAKPAAQATAPNRAGTDHEHRRRAQIVSFFLRRPNADAVTLRAVRESVDGNNQAVRESVLALVGLGILEAVAWGEADRYQLAPKGPQLQKALLNAGLPGADGPVTGGTKGGARKAVRVPPNVPPRR